MRKSHKSKALRLCLKSFLCLVSCLASLPKSQLGFVHGSLETHYEDRSDATYTVSHVCQEIAPVLMLTVTRVKRIEYITRKTVFESLDLLILD